MFTLFEESVKYHKFYIEALRYNKTETGASIIIENFFPPVRNVLPSIFDVGQHSTNFRSKNFNNVLDAGHYLYTRSIQKVLQAIMLDWKTFENLYTNKMNLSFKHIWA